MIAIDIRLENLPEFLRGMFEEQEAISYRIHRKMGEIGYIVQRTARRYAPYKDGDLERSIDFEVGDDYVDILVPINSKAGKYAVKRHDEHYQLGEKSRQKGSKVGRKYIERAIDDNRIKITRKFREATDFRYRGI